MLNGPQTDENQLILFVTGKYTAVLTPRLGFSVLWKTHLSILLFMEIFKSYCICSELREMGTGYYRSRVFYLKEKVMGS